MLLFTLLFDKTSAWVENCNIRQKYSNTSKVEDMFNVQMTLCETLFCLIKIMILFIYIYIFWFLQWKCGQKSTNLDFHNN